LIRLFIVLVCSPHLSFLYNKLNPKAESPHLLGGGFYPD
jgi:hypothetical protein